MYSVCDSPSHSWGAADPTHRAYDGNYGSSMSLLATLVEHHAAYNTTSTVCFKCIHLMEGMVA